MRTINNTKDMMEVFANGNKSEAIASLIERVSLSEINPYEEEEIYATISTPEWAAYVEDIIHDAVQSSTEIDYLPLDTDVA